VDGTNNTDLTANIITTGSVYVAFTLGSGQTNLFY